MCIITDGSEIPLPDNLEKVSDNHVSIVWRSENLYYKRSIPYLTSNEESFLRALSGSGIVPDYNRLDKYTLQLSAIKRTPDLGALLKEKPGKSDWLIWYNAIRSLRVLQKYRIIHGDLTAPHVLIDTALKVWFIDFAESRWEGDPAQPKRPETDWEQLHNTVSNFLQAAGVSNSEIKESRTFALEKIQHEATWEKWNAID